MAQTQLGFFGRLWLALTLPLRVIFNAALGTDIHGLLTGSSDLPETETSQEPTAMPATTPAVIDSEPVEEAQPESRDTTGLQVLAILQREGRFIDFLQEDVTSFSDEEVGAAATDSRLTQHSLAMATGGKAGEAAAAAARPRSVAPASRKTASTPSRP